MRPASFSNSCIAFSSTSICVILVNGMEMEYKEFYSYKDYLILLGIYITLIIQITV